MKFNPQLYIPCLQWKQGEYQALSKLSPNTQNSIVPLIEIAEIGFDFESRTFSKTIDEHLSPFATRVKDKWGKKECLVDFRNIGSSTLMANGQHPGAFIFDNLRSKGVLATPVIGMVVDPQSQAAVYQAISIDDRGLCFRVNIEEVVKAGFDNSMQTLVKSYGVAIEQCDLIIDLRAPNFEPLDGFTSLLSNIIRNLPYLDLWRSFGIIGTSFPHSLSGLKPGTSIIPRNEWRLYKLLEANLKDNGIRIPSFGDYAINHPDQLSLDMRFVKPNANVRYTINDNWLITKGNNVRDNGFAQYEKLCRMVIDSNHFYGQPYSKGDEYILACANNQVSTGNLTTWRWVGTNHHIEMVVRDVANLVAS